MNLLRRQPQVITNDGTFDGDRVASLDERVAAGHVVPNEYVMVLRSKGGKYFRGQGMGQTYREAMFTVWIVERLPDGRYAQKERLVEFPVMAGSKSYPVIRDTMRQRDARRMAERVESR